MTPDPSQYELNFLNLHIQLNVFICIFKTKYQVCIEYLIFGHWTDFVLAS